MEYSKIGKELEIYTNIDYIGKGFPIMLPNGAKMMKILQEMVQSEEEKRGYLEVKTPSASRAEIYMIEDRWEIKKNEIFKVQAKEEENYIVLRPYVKPFHCSIFNTKHHSYRELPIKYSETSTVFRDEPSSKIKGLTCMRQYTFSDASIFLSMEQLEKELKQSVEIEKLFMSKLGLDIEFKISNWDTSKKEEYIGTIEEWDTCTRLMKKVLDDQIIKYTENTDAKMYGPSIQIFYNDKMLAKIEIDFEITHRFDLKYTDKNGLEKVPIYINRQELGSYESMIAILTEKYEGEFPLWLTPMQCMVIPELDEYIDYANKIKESLRENKIRAKLDITEKSTEERIKKAKDLKIPYIIVITKKEYNNNQVLVIKKEEQKEYTVDKILKEIVERK